MIDTTTAIDASEGSIHEDVNLGQQLLDALWRCGPNRRNVCFVVDGCNYSALLTWNEEGSLQRLQLWNLDTSHGNTLADILFTHDDVLRVLSVKVDGVSYLSYNEQPLQPFALHQMDENKVKALRLWLDPILTALLNCASV